MSMHTSLSFINSLAEDSMKLLDLARWHYQMQALKLWVEQFSTGTPFITITTMKRLLKNTAIRKDLSGQSRDKPIRPNVASIAQSMPVL